MGPAIPDKITQLSVAPALDGLTLEAAEKMLSVAALNATQNNVSEAARRLGVSRMPRRYRIEIYELARGE